MQGNYQLNIKKKKFSPTFVRILKFPDFSDLFLIPAFPGHVETLTVFLSTCDVSSGLYIQQCNIIKNNTGMQRHE